MASGTPLPPRGVARAVWRALGELLPAPEIWQGAPEAPRSVVICPDPRLWHVPYGALLRGDTALVDVAEATLTPSLRTLCLVRGRARQAAPTGRDAGVAGSLLDDALPAHSRERAALDAWPGGHRPLRGLSHVAQLPDPALLYVSGHGAAPGDTALGPSGVTPDSLATLPLPELLLLVGCWSATAASRYGRDPLSLTVVGLLGGARTVVAGVGRVGERAAARIAAESLRYVAEGLPARSALRTAARTLRDRHPELGRCLRIGGFEHDAPPVVSGHPRGAGFVAWSSAHVGEYSRMFRLPRSKVPRTWRKPVDGPAATVASLLEAVRENEEVVPVNAVSTWVLPSGVTVGR